MKNLITIAIKTMFAICFFALLSCSKTKSPLDIDYTSIDLLEENAVSNFIENFKNSIKERKGSWAELKQAIQTETDKDSTSIVSLLVFTEYATTFLADKPQLCDSVFFMLCRLHADLPNAYNDYKRYYCAYEIPADKQEKINVIDKNVSDAGYEAQCDESDFYGFGKSASFYKKFENITTPTLAKHIKILVNTPSPYIEDAAMLISYNDLWNLIESTEIIAKYYPKTEIDEYGSTLENKVADYMSCMLLGVDNTPIYDEKTKDITDEIKTLYRKIAESGSQTRAQLTIKEYYDKLAENNFKYDTIIISAELDKLSTNLGVN